MLKKLCIYLILLLTATTAAAQLADGRINIDNILTVENDGTVSISFSVEISTKAIGKKETYAFAPILTDGIHRVSLPPVIIEGSRSTTGRARREWASGMVYDYPGATYASNGQVVNYNASVAAQNWMHGSQLFVEAVRADCCSFSEEKNLILAGPLHLYDEPAPREVVTEIKRFRPKSVADSLSMIFPFVIPESMFDPSDPYKIYDEEHDNSMIVYFHQSKYDIDPDYKDNAQTLTNLTAAVELILGEISTKVERVVVAGFASPEGSFDFNERLAHNRALAVKNHLIHTTDLREGQVWVHNGAVDWKGLRLLVSKSDMKEKQRILDILDNTPVMDETGKLMRLEQLKNLDNGEPYRYMLKEFFPLLRNGAFIKVYYSNRQQ